jgi:hypothetical protein
MTDSRVTIPTDPTNADDTRRLLYAIEKAKQAIADGQERFAHIVTVHEINPTLECLDAEGETETVEQLVTIAQDAGLSPQGFRDPRLGC